MSQSSLSKIIKMSATDEIIALTVEHKSLPELMAGLVSYFYKLIRIDQRYQPNASLLEEVLENVQQVEGEKNQ